MLKTPTAITFVAVSLTLLVSSSPAHAEAVHDGADHHGHADDHDHPAHPDDPIDTWLGSYAGNLNIYNPGKGPVTFPMKLDILELPEEEVSDDPEAPTAHVWRITYGEGARADIRNYRIVTRDVDEGRYEIDERNSILIPTYLTGNAFNSSFRLDTTVITLAYTLVDNDTIRFNLTSWDSGSLETSGGNGNVPEVISPRMTAYQSAFLLRTEPEEEPPVEDASSNE